MENFKTSIYIEDKALFDYAASSARLMQPVGIVSAFSLESSLKTAMASLRRCHRLVEKRCSTMAEPPSACRWLLDNMYLAKREYLSAAAAFHQAKKQSEQVQEIRLLSLTIQPTSKKPHVTL